MKKFLTYILKDPKTNFPFYIGKGLKHRPKRHLSEFKHKIKNKRPVTLKVQELHKKGLKPIIEIYKENITEDEAFKFEVELIKKFGRLDNKTGILLNLTNGGRRNDGYIVLNHPFKGKNHSKESKERIRNSLLGFKHTKETKKKLSEAKIGNKNALGAKHSKEANILKGIREKGNKKALGYKHTEESLKKISESSKLRKNNLGKKFSKEIREKMSKSQTGLKREIVICPHCKLKGGGGAMKQWHFNNCKYIKGDN